MCPLTLPVSGATHTCILSVATTSRQTAMETFTVTWFDSCKGVVNTEVPVQRWKAGARRGGCMALAGRAEAADPRGGVEVARRPDGGVARTAGSDQRGARRPRGSQPVVQVTVAVSARRG